MKHSGELILYKNFENGELFYNFTTLYKRSRQKLTSDLLAEKWVSDS